jgi:predicted phage terminase large subunit-like protein
MLTDLEKEILQKTIWDNPYIPKDHMPFPKQLDALLDFRKELLFGGSAGGGKAVALSTTIVTPNGTKLNGDLKVGDEILNPDGSTQRVTHIYDLGNQDIYRVTLIDGGHVDATLDHLWPIITPYNTTIILDTKSLINILNINKIVVLDGTEIFPLNIPSLTSPTPREITTIEKVGNEPCRCITVSNPNGLYIVNDDIITHNSDYLLMAALQFVEQPNYNAIIFRRTYSDLSLPEGLIPRSHEWLTHTPAQYKQDLHQWKFPSGSTLTFGYLESESHIYRYKSSSFYFIGFEELTEFPIERFYTYLFSRMRKSTDSKIPLRMRATTNPDGPGSEWVYERFKPDDPQPLENGRRFLSSKLYDNPHIDQESYIANLEETDPVTRMQLQEGVWRVKKSGNKFKQEWFDRCYINEEEVPEDGITVRYWDLAATELKPGTRTNNDPDYTVGAKIRLYHNVYYIMDIRRDRLSPGKLEEYIQETAEFDGPDTIIYLEQEPGSSGKIMVDDYIRRVLSGYAAFSDRPTGPKEARANVFSAALYNGMVRLVRAPWNKSFVTECCLFPTKGVHDDMVDSVSSGIGRLPRAKRWKTGNIGEISTFNPMAQDMIFDMGDLKIEDDGIEEFF